MARRSGYVRGAASAPGIAVMSHRCGRERLLLIANPQSGRNTWHSGRNTWAISTASGLYFEPHLVSRRCSSWSTTD